MKWLLLGLLGGSLISALIVWQGQRPTQCEHGGVMTTGDSSATVLGERTPGAALTRSAGTLPHVASEPESPDAQDDTVTYYSYNDEVELETIIVVERGDSGNWFTTSTTSCAPGPGDA